MLAGFKTENPLTTTEMIDLRIKNKKKRYNPVEVDEFINLAKSHVDYVHMF